MSSAPTTKRFILKTGEILSNNEFLSSANSAYYLIMQSDGNLCKYFGDAPGNEQGLLWSIFGKGRAEGSYFTIMQNNGTLCVYKGTGTTDKDKEILWRSTGGPLPAGDYFALIEDDGNVCIYRGKDISDKKGIVWKSGVQLPKPPPPGSRGEYLTSGEYMRTGEFLSTGSFGFFLIIQPDGNLCQYYGSGPGNNLGLIWSALNKPKPAGDYFLLLRKDGTLCIYSGTGPEAQGELIWSASNQPQSEEEFYILTLNYSGNVCVMNPRYQYDDPKGIVWQTNIHVPVKPKPIGIRKPEHLTLKSGDILKPNDFLRSPDSAFHFVMQFDGNLCGYSGADPAHRLGSHWRALDKAPAFGDHFAILQTDGNLCIYEGSGPDDRGGLIWAAFEGSWPEGDYYAVVEDDGFLYIYSTTLLDHDGKPRNVWMSQPMEFPMKKLPEPACKGFILRAEESLDANEYLVSPNSAFHLIMQSSGNLCAYHGADPFNNKGLIWQNSDDVTVAGQFFVFLQNDGILTVNKGSASIFEGIIWSAPIDPQPVGDYFFMMEDTGSISVYSGKGLHDKQKLVWQSNPAVLPKPVLPVDLALLMQKNPGLNLFSSDLYSAVTLKRMNWKGRWSEFGLLLTYQRLMRITKNDAALANLLFNNGWKSGQHITRDTNFIKKYASLLLLQEADACREFIRTHKIAKTDRGYTYDIASFIFRNALAAVKQSNHLLAAVHSISGSPQFKNSSANTISPEITERFESMTGFDELFGNKDSCTCGACSSAFGTAAYFADLLKITDNVITKKNAIADGNKLSDRRPGFVKIPLTCESSNAPVPSLQIVNEVLETTIVQQLKAEDPGTEPDVFYTLATQTYPFNMPYSLPLNEIRSGLSAAGTNLSEIMQAFGADEKSLAFALETLNMPVEEFNLVSKPAKGKILASHYGKQQLSVEEMDELCKLENFSRITGLNKVEINELLYHNLGDAEKATGSFQKDFFINRDLAAVLELITVTDKNSGEKYERINTLNEKTLDRINRFVRLAKKVSWTFEELDWAMISINAGELDEPAIKAIASIKTLADKFDVPVIELCACWFDMKTSGTGKGKNSAALFDKIVNPPIGMAQQLYHPDMKTVKRAANPFYKDNLLSWKTGKNILSGMSVSNDDLTAIAQRFIGNDPSAFLLDVPGLSMLYRHSFIAGFTGNSVAEYLTLLKILGKQEKEITPAALVQIADAAGWMKAAGFTPTALDYILNFKQEDAIPPYFNQLYSYTDLEKFLLSLQLILRPVIVNSDTFKTITIENNPAKDVFEQLKKYFTAGPESQPLDLTGIKLKDLESVLIREKYKDSNSLLKKITDPDVYLKALLDALVEKKFVDRNGLIQKRIADKGKKPVAKELSIVITLEVDTNRPKKEIVKATVQLTADQVATLFQKINFAYADQQQKSTDTLADFFGTQSELMKEIVEGIAEPTGIYGISALFAENSYKIDAAIHDHIIAISKWLMIARALELNVQEIKNILKFPVIYDLDPSQPLTLEHLQNFKKMKDLVNVFGDQENKLISYLADAATIPFEKPFGLLIALQEITCWNKEYADYLSGTALFDDEDPYASAKYLFRMNQCQDICRKTQLDVRIAESLKDLLLKPVTKENWQMVQSVSALVFKKADASLLEQKRDALSRFAIYKLGRKHPGLDTIQKLNEFLLTDTAISGSEETTYIKDALRSVQQYMQRCRLGLEKNVRIGKEQMSDTCWEWIFDHVKWQENRKLFMYPENYMDPGKRKNKTGLFKSLEADLKKKTGTENAERAFISYFNEFENLAKLQYADALNCMVNTTQGQEEKLFLFARTATQPNEYYYISQTQEQWSQWEKIDVPIPAEYITPVYAFNKLFLFWTELKKTEEPDQTSQDRWKQATVWKTMISYTFLEPHGKWSTAQTLIAGQVVNIQSERSLCDPFDNALFSEEHPYWKKVGAVAIDPSSIALASYNNPDGKILLHYGPLLDSAGWPEETTVNPDDRLTGTFAAFQKTIIRGNELMTAAQKLDNKGFVPLFKIELLDPQLKPSLFIDRSESFIFLNSPSELPSYNFWQEKEEWSRSWNHFLYEDAISNPYYANYMDALFKKPQRDDHVQLFPSVSGTNSGFISVKNNPGMFLLTEQGETFLVNANKYKPLTSSQKIGDTTLMNKLTAKILSESLHLQEEDCEILYNLLRFLNVIGENGFVNFPASYKVLQAQLKNSNAIIDSEQNAAEAPFAILLPEIGQAIDQYSKDADDVVAGNVRMKKVMRLKEQLMREREEAAQPFVALKESIKRIEHFFFQDGQVARLWLFLSDIQPNAGLLYNDQTNFRETRDLNYTVKRLTANGIDSLAGVFATGGVEALLSLRSKQMPGSKKEFSRLQPHGNINYKNDRSFIASDNILDFNGPYGNYYRELFFHAPLLIAEMLHDQQQFADAEKWFQYVYDADAAEKQTLESLSDRIQSQQGEKYEKDPLDAYAVADLRLVTSEKSLLLKRIKNLLDWADSRIAENTPESIAAATGLYTVVSEFIGPKQDRVSTTGTAHKNILQINSEIPEFFIQLENAILKRPEDLEKISTENDNADAGIAMPFNNLEGYFCVPENEQFTAYRNRAEGNNIVTSFRATTRNLINESSILI